MVLSFLFSLVQIFIIGCTTGTRKNETLLEKFSKAKLPLVVSEDFTYEYGEWEWISDKIIEREYKILDKEDLLSLHENVLDSVEKFYSRQVALKMFEAAGGHQLLLFTRDLIAKNQEELAHEDDLILVLAVLSPAGMVTDKIIIGRDRPEQLLITSELDQNLILKIRIDSIPLIGNIKTSYETYRFNNGRFVKQ